MFVRSKRHCRVFHLLVEPMASHYTHHHTPPAVQWSGRVVPGFVKLFARAPFSPLGTSFARRCRTISSKSRASLAIRKASATSTFSTSISLPREETPVERGRPTVCLQALRGATATSVPASRLRPTRRPILPSTSERLVETRWLRAHLQVLVAPRRVHSPTQAELATVMLMSCEQVMPSS